MRYTRIVVYVPAWRPAQHASSSCVAGWSSASRLVSGALQHCSKHSCNISALQARFERKAEHSKSRIAQSVHGHSSEGSSKLCQLVSSTGASRSRSFGQQKSTSTASLFLLNSRSRSFALPLCTRYILAWRACLLAAALAEACPLRRLVPSLSLPMSCRFFKLPAYPLVQSAHCSTSILP